MNSSSPRATDSEESEEPDRIAEIKRRRGHASTIISDLCHGKREWLMSIPARPNYDPDLVLNSCLHDIDWLLTQLERLSPATPSCTGEQEPTVALRVLERLASVADCGTVQEIVEALRDACVSFLAAKTENDSDLWWTTLRAHAYILREDWDGAGNPVPQETTHE